MDQDLDKPIVTGVGLPDFQKHLTQGDERRMDDKGRPIVTGKAWGDSATGAYLTVMICKPMMPKTDTKVYGQTLQLGSSGYCLGLYTSVGKPTFRCPVVGACLELPEDLAKDPLKIKYVTEWFTDTILESAAIVRLDPSELPKVSLSMANVVDDAIRAVGL